MLTARPSVQLSSQEFFGMHQLWISEHIVQHTYGFYNVSKNGFTMLKYQVCLKILKSFDKFQRKLPGI